MHSHCAHAKEVMSCGWRARCGVERTVARHHPFRKVDIQKVALQEPARTRVHEILVAPTVVPLLFPVREPLRDLALGPPHVRRVFEVHRQAAHLAEEPEGAVLLRVGCHVDDGVATRGAEGSAPLLRNLVHDIGIVELPAGQNGEQPAVADSLRLPSLHALLQERLGVLVHPPDPGPLLVSQTLLRLP